MGAELPYKSFGNALKKLREQYSKTQAEVSGAVEIEQQRLADYELGKERPSEDILMLIIQHFNLGEQEANRLWKLAGYQQADADNRTNFNDDVHSLVRTVLVGSADVRIVYTDMVQVMVNNFGVVMNFMQGAGPNNQPLAISRVGMSKEHAKSVLDLLAKTLKEADDVNKPQAQKRLPPPKHREQSTGE